MTQTNSDNYAMAFRKDRFSISYQEDIKKIADEFYNEILDRAQNTNHLPISITSAIKQRGKAVLAYTQHDSRAKNRFLTDIGARDDLEKLIAIANNGEGKITFKIDDKTGQMMREERRRVGNLEVVYQGRGYNNPRVVVY